MLDEGYKKIQPHIRFVFGKGENIIIAFSDNCCIFDTLPKFDRKEFLISFNVKADMWCVT